MRTQSHGNDGVNTKQGRNALAQAWQDGTVPTAASSAPQGQPQPDRQDDRSTNPGTAPGRSSLTTGQDQ